MSKWKCSIWTGHSWSCTGFWWGSNIWFIISEFIFLGRPLRALPVRQRAASSRRFCYLNDLFLVPCAIFSCSQTSLIVTLFDRWSMAWKKRFFFLMVSASWRLTGTVCGGGVDGAMVECWMLTGVNWKFWWGGLLIERNPISPSLSLPCSLNIIMTSRWSLI